MIDPLRDEVVHIAAELIRIDTSSYGDGTGPGERLAAEYDCALLAEVGLETTLVESAPGRANVLVDVAGSDPARPCLLVHAHLDTVPADAAAWSAPPHAGEIRDGQLYGRGAVDMKHFVAMMLATIRRRCREGRPPNRPLRLTFTADEEAGGPLGAHWLVTHHRAFFEDCTETIGEVGGFSVNVGARRVYLVETGERGIAWLRLVARGTAGHGSMHQPDNAVLHLARAVAAISEIEWPLQLGTTGRELLQALADVPGSPDLILSLLQGERTDALVQEALTETLGPAARMVISGMRNSANPTMLQAGYKHNVIPDRAEARIDGRFLPGQQDQLLEVIAAQAGRHVDVVQDFMDVAVESPVRGSLTEAMGESLRRHDPVASWAPYFMSGGSDAKAWSRLGIHCYGFTPLRLPRGFDFSAVFHGVDERVPVDALVFGVDVLDTLLDLA